MHHVAIIMVSNASLPPYHYITLTENFSYPRGPTTHNCVFFFLLAETYCWICFILRSDTKYCTLKIQRQFYWRDEWLGLFSIHLRLHIRFVCRSRAITPTNVDLLSIKNEYRWRIWKCCLHMLIWAIRSWPQQVHVFTLLSDNSRMIIRCWTMLQLH